MSIEVNKFFSSLSWNCLVASTWIGFSNCNLSNALQEPSVKPDVVVLGAATVSCIIECLAVLELSIKYINKRVSE